MYEVVFKDMGFRLPFSDFQREVLRWTKLSPSQIHPNSYALMRTFELVCEYFKIPVFKNVFFAILTVHRGNDWVSFRQTKKMFEIFAGKVQSFKERFFLVRPKSEAALSTLLGVARDGSCRPFFPLCWKQDHFRLDPKNFSRTAPSLKEEEEDAYQKIWAFVQSFSRKTKTYKRGNLLMNADGTPVTEPRFINTHELVVFQDPDDCLGSYISFYFILTCCHAFSFVSDLFFPTFVFAERMKDLQVLVNEANKKLTARKWHKIVPSVDQLMDESGPGSTSSPVVDLEKGDRSGERVQEPVKRRRVETPSKDPVTPIKAIPLRFESGDFLQLPKVWSEPDRCCNTSFPNNVILI